MMESNKVSEKPIFAYTGAQGKFPAWFAAYLNEDGNIKVFVRGEQFVLSETFVEPGHLETITIPKERLADLVIALLETLPAALESV